MASSIEVMLRTRETPLVWCQEETDVRVQFLVEHLSPRKIARGDLSDLRRRTPRGDNYNRVLTDIEVRNVFTNPDWRIAREW